MQTAEVGDIADLTGITAEYPEHRDHNAAGHRSQSGRDRFVPV